MLYIFYAEFLRFAQRFRCDISAGEGQKRSHIRQKAYRTFQMSEKYDPLAKGQGP